MKINRTQRKQFRTVLACLLAIFGLSIAASLLVEPSTAAGAGIQPQLTWPQINLVEVASGLQAPVHVTHAGDNSDRIFVVEQPGRIRLIKNKTLQDDAFLDIQERVLFGGEQGLLSVAFPPQYNVKGYFYVYYTNNAGDNVVSRFYLSSDNPDQANPGSEELVLYLHHPSQPNHNGGQLAFGPDGYFYIGTGDGGGGGDPLRNAQNTESLLGKILRIDVEAGAETYQIPDDNPFKDQSGYRPEIWALGLRNPWRFSFDRQTGDLYIADVGQGSFEEVNYQPASSQGGENYGWNIMEGPECFQSGTCNQSGLTLPVFSYQTRVENTCAVTGGHVYRGSVNPTWQGVYFFGDFCSGAIWGLQREGESWENSGLANTSLKITSFGEDQAGELYVADQSGTVYAIQNTHHSNIYYFPAMFNE